MKHTLLCKLGAGLLALLMLAATASACDTKEPDETTDEVTVADTDAPTEAPTEQPTEAPTEAPTETPTETPATGCGSALGISALGLMALCGMAVVIRKKD